MPAVKTLLPLLAAFLLPSASQADGVLNTRHKEQARPVQQPAWGYRQYPGNTYHYPGRGDQVIIIHRPHRNDGYDIYQRNLRRHQQDTRQQPAVDNRPRQCLGNHCGNE